MELTVPQKDGKSSFVERCYKQLRQVPKGNVTTYALLAAAAGSPKAFRAVGSAMKHNPQAPEVPCHRVVKSDGSLGEYAYGTKKKAALLAKEGVTIKDGKVVDFKEALFTFGA